MLKLMSLHHHTSYVLRTSLLVLTAVALTGLGPMEVQAKPSSQSAAKAPKTSKASAKKTKAKKATTKKSSPQKVRIRRRRVKNRCRDIFCTTQVVRMDSAATEGQALTESQVETTIKKHRQRWDPCLVNVRRRDPTKKVARLEFVVTGKGKVLATRVDGKRYSPLSKCLLRQMRSVSFPTFKQPRAVASVTLAIPQ